MFTLPVMERGLEPGPFWFLLPYSSLPGMISFFLATAVGVDSAKTALLSDCVSWQWQLSSPLSTWVNMLVTDDPFCFPIQQAGFSSSLHQQKKLSPLGDVAKSKGSFYFLYQMVPRAVLPSSEGVN